MPRAMHETACSLVLKCVFRVSVIQAKKHSQMKIESTDHVNQYKCCS